MCVCVCVCVCACVCVCVCVMFQLHLKCWSKQTGILLKKKTKNTKQQNWDLTDANSQKCRTSHGKFCFPRIALAMMEGIVGSRGGLV